MLLVQLLFQKINPPQQIFRESQDPLLIELLRVCAGISLSSQFRLSRTTFRTRPFSSRIIPTSSSSSYRTRHSKFPSSKRCQGIKARPIISSSCSKMECRSVAKNWLHLLAARRTWPLIITLMLYFYRLTDKWYSSSLRSHKSECPHRWRQQAYQATTSLHQCWVTRRRSISNSYPSLNSIHQKAALMAIKDHNHSYRSKQEVEHLRNPSHLRTQNAQQLRPSLLTIRYPLPQTRLPSRILESSSFNR